MDVASQFFIGWSPKLIKFMPSIKLLSNSSDSYSIYERFSPCWIYSEHIQYEVVGIEPTLTDYLLKPVDIDELRETMIRFTDAKKNKQKRNLPLKLKTQYSLTDREIGIIVYLLEGKSSKEIAAKLFINKHTVDTHRRNILKRMGIKSTEELLALLNTPI